MLNARNREVTVKHPPAPPAAGVPVLALPRPRLPPDIPAKGGQFDVLTIGPYEVPIWAKKNWLIPLDNLGADYDTADLLPRIRDAVSVSGKLYAAPFYGESSMVMYRTDLFQKA